ncbi:MAG: Nramp family divalent metal transporter [Vulcanimicrobiaceae bacterium]
MRKPFWHYLGPGIISGASDNDPTTVASLAVIGSTTVFGLGWLVILVIPMLAVVQAISAQIGAITKRGIEDDVRKYYGRGLALVMLAAVLIVNFVTLTADLEGGGAALQVLTSINYRWWILPIAIAALAMLIFGNYEKIKKLLLVFPMLFLAYPVAAIMAHPDWHAVFAAMVPHFEHSKDYASGAIALLGTTLTSYAYVWQTIETAKERPPVSRLGLVQADTTLGTVIAGISFLAIVIATGATLGVHHQQVDTADQAAQALKPIAGAYASILFGLGLLGSALIAVPVLAATSAYVMNGMFGWHASLDKKWWQAKRFYSSMIVITLLASVVGLAGAPPIKVLYFGSILGGIGTPVSLAIMLLLGRRKDAMHGHPIGLPLAFAGWAVTGIVTVAAIVYLLSLAQ